MVSCLSSKKAQKDVIVFTKKYRNYFSEKELTDRKNAAFINQAQIELVGLPSNSKTVWFDDNYMVEGNWIHIIVPAGTVGKIITVVSLDRFKLQFSKKDTIKFFFELDNKTSSIYVLSVKTDPHPKIPPKIREKYIFTADYQYVDYLGGKFYFVEDKNGTCLQVKYKFLKDKDITLEGLDK